MAIIQTDARETCEISEKASARRFSFSHLLRRRKIRLIARIDGSARPSSIPSTIASLATARRSELLHIIPNHIVSMANLDQPISGYNNGAIAAECVSTMTHWNHTERAL
jgi:hypothetical protein